MHCKTLTLALILLLLSFTVHFVQSTLPDFRQQHSYKHYRAEVRYDRWKIPRIKAENLESLYFALGHAVAKERLFSITKKVAVATGRLSQLFGTQTLRIDKFFREVGLARVAERTVERISKEDPQLHKLLLAYCEGVNRFAAESTFLPLEFHLVRASFRPITPADLLSVYKLLQFHLSSGNTEPIQEQRLIEAGLAGLTEEVLGLNQNSTAYAFPMEFILDDSELRLMNLSREVKAERVETVEGAKGLLGEHFEIPETVAKEVLEKGASNSWVVSGQVTKSGKPILANDPHLQNQIPSVWFKAELLLEADGKVLCEVGNLMDGFPFVLLGRTEEAALGSTMIYADVFDYYVEDIDAETATYLLDGKRVPLVRHDEYIAVKGQEPVLHPVYETHRGPVLSLGLGNKYLHELKKPTSLAWVGFSTEYQSVKILSQKIKLSYQELKEKVLRINDGPTQNLVVVSRGGEIGYFSSGAYPLTDSISTAFLDGTTSRSDWKGLIPPSEKLHLMNPPKQFIVTANSKPTGPLYKHNIFDRNRFTTRMFRINKLLRPLVQRGDITALEMWHLQEDTVDQLCLVHVRLLAKHVEPALETFDCNFTTNSVLATKYTLAMRRLAELIEPEHTHLLSVNYLHRSSHLVQKFGPEIKKTIAGDPRKDQPYGLFAQMYYPHTLSKNPLLDFIFSRSEPCKGNEQTVSVAKLDKIFAGHCSNHANMRMVISMDDREKSYWTTDTGQSGHLLSNNYFDMRGQRIELRWGLQHFRGLEPGTLHS